MRALLKKAKSQAGASITFALLLFLVCAVISSVVIVAATAAAGRMSGQIDMDERYYAVSAVVTKLRGSLEGKTAELEYEKNPTESEDGEIDLGEVKVEVGEIDVTETWLGNTAQSVLKAVMSPKTGELPKETRLVTIPEDESGDFTDSNPDSDELVNDSSGDDSVDSAITCEVYQEIREDGLLIYRVIATGGKWVFGSYTIELTFSSNVRFLASDDRSSTRTAFIEWKLLNIKKLRADSSTE